MNNLKKLHLIHKLIEWEGPALSEGLKVLCLFNIDIDGLEGFELLKLLSRETSLNQRVDDSRGLIRHDDLIVNHLLQDKAHTLLNRKLIGMNVKIGVLWCLIGV